LGAGKTVHKDNDWSRGMCTRFGFAIALGELAWQVHRPLIRPGREEERPDLADVLLEDRLATGIAERLQELAQPDRWHPRLGLQEAVDLRLERIELRGGRRPRVLRRISARECATDRLAMQAGAPRELADRDPVDEVQTPQLCPLLHDQHDLPPDPIWTAPGQGASGRKDEEPRGGSPFNRRQRGSIGATATSV
jgi:hypothetical protein